jgi:hypothetical protein
MPPTTLPHGSLFSDSEVGEATTQTEDPPIFSSTLETLTSSEATTTSNYPTSDDDWSEADSVMERLTRSVGRLFSRVSNIVYINFIIVFGWQC